MVKRNLSFALTVGLIISVVQAAVTGIAQARASSDVAIVGWEAFDLDQEQPPANFGKDPVIGRLVCPPMTRLNLRHGRSEGLLVQNPSVVAGDDKQGVEWHIPLRSGIYWWSGQPVTVKDLANFWQARLDAMKSSQAPWMKLTGSTVPKFSVDSSNQAKLVIHWDEKPKFGPYVLNGTSFYKPVEGPAKARPYQCAGLYKPGDRGIGSAFHLEATPGYPRSRPSFWYEPVDSKNKASSPSPLTVQSSSESTSLKEKSKNRPSPKEVLFTTAEAIGGDPWTRKSDDQASCQVTLDQPYVSAIVWNLNKPPFNQVALRNLLTKLTPRGALLRSGAGRLGELVSGPLVRQHPGYEPKMRIKPFDIPAAAHGLETLGYLRSAPDGPRLNPEGKPFIVRIGLLENSSGLTGKVIIDGFAALGIKVETTQFKGQWKDVDGVLTGLKLDWPGHDFIADFHSDRMGSELPLVSIPGFDALLETYSVSLTSAKPQFDVLRKIHGKLYELEPMTTLFQHKACLATKGIRAAAKAVNVLDPDWFKKIVL